LLGSLVKKLIGNFDASVLGVKVTVGALHIIATSAKIEVEDLTIANPDGYHSPYLLRADKMIVDLELQKLIFSMGKDVDIEEIHLSGVDVIYEKAFRTSNVNDILKHLTGEAKEQAKAKEDEAKKQAPEVTLHRVLAENIGAKAASVITRGFGIRLEVGDICYEDFSKEMNAGRGLMEVVRVLLVTLLKSILATIIGKRAIKKVTGCCSSTASQPLTSQPTTVSA